MVVILSDLSRDVLASIFDLIDGVSILSLILTGDGALCTKLYGAVRHFEYKYPPTGRATWPKLLSRFSALESLDLSISYPYVYLPISGMDILSLPPTLRKMNLNSCNSLLALLDLPPQDYNPNGFVPSLRSGFRERFVNLENLRCNTLRTTDMRNWDFSRFAEETRLWLNITFPSLLVDWDHLAKLPNDTTALDLNLNQSYRPTAAQLQHLPFSLSQLSIFGSECLDSSFFDVIPEHLQSLSMYVTSERPEIPDLSAVCRLHLTHFSFNIKKCTVAHVTHLPTTLTSLGIGAQHAELEIFSHFPPNLTLLDFTWETLTSTATQKTIDCEISVFEVWYGNGLPHDFSPNMRESIVLKLPRGLKRIPWSIFSLIRPEDWDALPREANCSNSSDDGIAVRPHHVQYLPSLPKNCTAFSLTHLEPKELQLLPRILTSLCLSLSRGPSRLDPQEPHYTKRLFQSLSGFPNLLVLKLKVGSRFDARFLGFIGAQVEELTLVLSRDFNVENATFQIGEEIPSMRSLARVKYFTLETLPLRILVDHWPLLMSSCVSLENLSLFEVDTEEGPAGLPIDQISVLPRSLLRLYAPLDRMDASFFPCLPPSLTELNLFLTPEGGYELEDLKLLPKSLVSITLPCPTTSWSESEAMDFLDSMIPSHFTRATTIEILGDEEYNSTAGFNRDDVPRYASLDGLLDFERNERLGMKQQPKGAI